MEAIVPYRASVPALGGAVSVLPLLEAIAERYGVPVISPEEAEAFCAVEGLELLEPMVGAESEIEPPILQTYVYLSANIAPATVQLRHMKQGMLEIANRWNDMKTSIGPAQIPDRPRNFQEAIEAKKNKGKFYDGLDTRKGLDKPNK